MTRDAQSKVRRVNILFRSGEYLVVVFKIIRSERVQCSSSVIFKL